MASTQFTANSNGEKGGKKFGFWALIIVITLAVLILIFNSFTVVNDCLLYTSPRPRDS